MLTTYCNAVKCKRPVRSPNYFCFHCWYDLTSEQRRRIASCSVRNDQKQLDFAIAEAAQDLKQRKDKLRNAGKLV